jgi:hypothetical protein
VISEEQLRELVQLAQKRSAVFDIVSNPFRFRWNLRIIHKRGLPWSNRQKKDATKGFLAVRRLSGGISTSRKNSTPECSTTVATACVSSALERPSMARRFRFGSKHTMPNAGRSAEISMSAHGRDRSAWAKSSGVRVFPELAPSDSAWG